MIERKYILEKETVKEEIDIKHMTMDEIVELLESKGIRIKDENDGETPSFSSTDELWATIIQKLIIKIYAWKAVSHSNAAKPDYDVVCCVKTPRGVRQMIEFHILLLIVRN